MPLKWWYNPPQQTSPSLSSFLSQQVLPRDLHTPEHRDQGSAAPMMNKLSSELLSILHLLHHEIFLHDRV